MEQSLSDEDVCLIRQECQVLAAQSDQAPVGGPPNLTWLQRRGDPTCRLDLASRAIRDPSARWCPKGAP